MVIDSILSPDEALELPQLYRGLLRDVAELVEPGDVDKLRKMITEGIAEGKITPRHEGIHPVMHAMHTARLLCEMISPDRNMVLTVLLSPLVEAEIISVEEIADLWGEDVGRLVNGHKKIFSLYGHQSRVVKNDNFRNLLLTFAEDIRVIIIMIVDRQALMRLINHYPDEEFVREVAAEAAYLYAPLAHRLGLYKIKSELEDLSLKYTDRDIYTRIAKGLNEKKKSRDEYIDAFIKPVRERLEAMGLNFTIKGRTKSIYSIWNKLRRQQVELKDVYDLFAIRIILDVPTDKESDECWNVYSVITSMYTPNPDRMKDWVTHPKSNGYESLHITVQGPQNKWVEVQIRTRRMDLIAEKGLAAHWKYKGLKSEGSLDTWMNNVRDILESQTEGPLNLMKNMKMDIYNKEVFVFTPKGDLFKLPLGATVLDLAFTIHSNLGAHCTGGKVNGRNRKINCKLRSGDTVEILSSTSQTPKQDWLNIVCTGKARTKIRQALNESAKQDAELGRELLLRRAKNRKIDMVEATQMKLIKQLGYKTATGFFADIANKHLDVANVLEQYEALADKLAQQAEKISADGFQLPEQTLDDTTSGGPSIVIGDNIKGINYKLAKCCHPIYGDNVFGFVSAEGVIKIHRKDCPNARDIRRRYPNRLIATRWAGKQGEQFPAMLSIVGQDDIGIVTNITSLINKEPNVSLRSISIDSDDGIFRGYLGVGISDTEALNALIKKLRTVKGVKDVSRN